MTTNSSANAALKSPTLGLRPASCHRVRNAIVLAAIVLVAAASLRAQTASISGIINQYSSVTAIDYCTNTITVDAPNLFSVGSRALLVQMQGATIDESNTVNFGTIKQLNDAGRYEVVTIAAVNGNRLLLRNTLFNDYDPADAVQLVTIPQYRDVSVASTLTAAQWNGSTGGVLMFEASGTLTLHADIDVSGTGFRGGDTSIANRDVDEVRYAYPSASGKAGMKGEGIARTVPGSEAGRGPQATGGGGGNAHNSGGGGGGNLREGGKGGDEFYPGPLSNLSSRKLPVGGLGGRGIGISSFIERILLGGGGGGGHQNEGQGTRGTNGGGIAIVRAGAIVGNDYFIKANGIDQTIIAGIDGAGGGGAGGTILIGAPTIPKDLNLEARGGRGGDNQSDRTGMSSHGTGGGGAGGLIGILGNVISSDVPVDLRAGRAGVILNRNSEFYASTYGATAGIDGTLLTVQSVVENTTPFATVTADAGPDITICIEHGAPIGGPPRGGRGPYTYKWSPSKGLSSSTVAIPIANPDTTTTYVLTVSDVHGCASAVADTVTVTVIQPALLLGGLDGVALHIDSTAFGQHRCGTMTMQNTRDYPITLQWKTLARNREFSIPPDQFPLTIAPGEQRTLHICYTPSLRGEDRDTLLLDVECPQLIALVAHASATSFTGITGCGTPITVHPLADSEYFFSASAPFPNPASATITLPAIRHQSSKMPSAAERCVVRNVMGDVVTEAFYQAGSSEPAPGPNFEQGQFTFDVSALPQGIYFATIAAADRVMVFPVVVRR